MTVGTTDAGEDPDAGQVSSIFDEGRMPFLCGDCGKWFYPLTARDRHKRLSHGLTKEDNGDEQ